VPILVAKGMTEDDKGTLGLLKLLVGKAR